MGSTLQWRGENEREPTRYGKVIAFGNLRDHGTGYMSYSDRVGPGIVVLGGTAAHCDHLTEAGFTALAPDIPPDAATAERLLTAAVDHLVDNWHPRVGIVSFGSTRELARGCTKSLDALVLLEEGAEIDEDLIDDLRYDLS